MSPRLRWVLYGVGRLGLWLPGINADLSRGSGTNIHRYSLVGCWLGAEDHCPSWCRASWPAQGRSCAPAIHAAQHERAGRANDGKRGRLYRWPVLEEQPAARPSYTVSPAGQRLKHSRPAVGAAQAVGRHKKAPPEREFQRGQSGPWNLIGEVNPL